MSKIIDLAKKLKRLSEQGVGGERENAADALIKILQKHNISIEEIEEEEIITAWYAVRKNQEVFFGQIVSTVIGDKFPIYGRNGDRKKGLKVTRAQAAEIEMAFAFYWKLYESELDLFLSAFIKKNDLYPKDGEVKFYDESDLSPEEIDRLKRVSKLADGIKADSLRTRIES